MPILTLSFPLLVHLEFKVPRICFPREMVTFSRAGLGVTHAYMIACLQPSVIGYRAEP